MRVYCTGISGVGASEHIKRVKDYATKKGEEIKVFSIGREVFKQAEKSGFPVTNTGVLDLDKRTLSYLTMASYEKIAKEVSEHENCIVDAHINFRWRGAIVTPVNFNMVDYLKPDVYVTIMDLARPIIDRLKKDKAQWRHEIEEGNITISNTLDLQNIEVNMTEKFALHHNKQSYVLPSQDSPDSLYKLTTKSNTEVAYVSFPITHILQDKGSAAKIDSYVEKLREFDNLAVITPRAVILPKDPSRIEDQHTVTQDLDWFVEKSSKRIFVYFPLKVHSRGVAHESIRANGSCKEVWFTAPKEMTDPFTNSTINRRFYEPEECLEALVTEGMKRQT
jgi:adenylate kinase